MQCAIKIQTPLNKCRNWTKVQTEFLTELFHYSTPCVVSVYAHTACISECDIRKRTFIMIITSASINSKVQINLSSGDMDTGKVIHGFLGISSRKCSTANTGMHRSSTSLLFITSANCIVYCLWSVSSMTAVLYMYVAKGTRVLLAASEEQGAPPPPQEICILHCLNGWIWESMPALMQIHSQNSKIYTLWGQATRFPMYMCT